MNVNFDNLRKRGVNAYNNLCDELNKRIHGDYTISDSREHGDPLTVGDIKNEMESLREVLITLICVEDSNGGFGALSMKIKEFAPDEQ